MSNPTRLKGNIDVRGKRRLVTKTKWEMPFHDSKPYWDKICNDIESKVSMTVRTPNSTIPNLYPVIFPPSIRYSATSSVSRGNLSVFDFSNHLATEIVDGGGSRSIIAATAPPSSSPDTVVHTKLTRNSVAVSRDLIEDSNDRSDSSSSLCRLTKLSKMRRLVNDFLSSTRTRVTSAGTKSTKLSSSTKRTSEKDRNYKSILVTEKSFDRRSKNDTSEYESFKGKMTTQETTEKTEIFDDAIMNLTPIDFRDNLGETIENDVDQKDEFVTVTKPRRARAPSLSVASALPSFGKILISIEDIDSTVNEEDRDDPFRFSNHVTSKDYRKSNEPDEPQVDERKSMENFLKVPQVRTTGSASYPTHDESEFRQKTESTEKRLMEESYESKLLRESRVFRKKYPFWPKRSIVHVFRALKTMKNGLRSKARIESECNKFFASPLDLYSPSVKTSISSDDQTDFTNANVPLCDLEQTDDDEIMDEGDDHENGSTERIDIESNSSSYASVRERLMRNALAHLSKDSQRDAASTCIDVNNIREATFEQANPSSFYNSWATSKNEVVTEHRNKKTLKRHFIGIPRVTRIFPRVKADKCLACMCQSLGDIDQPQRRKTAGTCFDDEIGNNLIMSDARSSSEILRFDLPTETLFAQFYRDQYRPTLSADKATTKSLLEDQPSGSLHANVPNDQAFAANFDDSRCSIQESVVDSLSKTSQINDPHLSRMIVKSPTKSLISAKSLMTSLSLISERSRSISDQDDSDQGGMGSVGNDVDLGAVSASKYLAPCHMPINLKPSLEPLKALRSKKSRSIRSRVASAEKSGDSANDDDDDSDYEEHIRGQPSNEAMKKLDADTSLTKFRTVSSPSGDKMQKIVMKKDRDVSSDDFFIIDQTQSVDESEGPISSKRDVDNVVKTHFFDNISIISDREVIEISANCLENNMTINETLRVLANEYINRLSNRFPQGNRLPSLTIAQRNAEMATNLLTLLVDSKNYLNRDKRSHITNDPHDPSFSFKQPGLCNSRQLRRILPLKSYNLVAPILGMAKWYPSRKMISLRDVARKASRMDPQEKSIESAFDLKVHPPSRLEQNVLFEKSSKDSRSKLSPYSLFLRKTRRKAITWRPLTERDLEGYDPEATLKMRAAKITDKICEDFCHWLESLAVGTNQTNGIDTEVLKDMFETDFTAEVCSTMQVCIKEMPMVPTAVAVARNCPGAGELALTRRHLVKDARAEMRPKKIVGFGTPLPVDLKFVPPRNGVNEKWLQCKNVPKDLETMEVVWKGITHLTSVQGFIKWLRAQPEVKRPKALEKLLPTRETLMRKKSVIDDFKHLELDRDQIQSLKVADNAPDAY